MGRDKALLEVAGRPLAAVAAGALEGAGASEVFCVGGDLGGLRAQGLVVAADQHPGEGPLGALITALGLATEDVVMVLSCDLPGASATAVAAVVHSLTTAPRADLAVPVAGGRRQWLHAAYRRRTLPHWAAAFAAGERSLRRPAAHLEVVDVEGLDSSWLLDVDVPGDLPGTTG